MRGVAGAIAALLILASQAPAQVLSARLTQPTLRYDHGVLGDAVEWGGMDLTGPLGRVTVTLPPSRVFEDVEARVLDLDGDGLTEVLVVETDLARGASLAVYDMTGRVTATPFLGQRHRWLAPLGVADLDGDGLPEIAYVDRPHLAKDLVIVRYRGGRLHEGARAHGLTNHRIGDRAIFGGIRSCGQGAEAVLASADWTRIVAVRMVGDALRLRDVGALEGPRDIARALRC